MLTRAAVLLTTFLVSACGTSAGHTRASTASAAGPVAVGYEIDAARPPTRFSLDIGANGEATLFLGAAFANTREDTVGFFRAPLAPERRSAVAAFIDQHDLMSRNGGASATAEGSGSMRLTSGSRVSVIGLAQSDPTIDSFRAMLDALVPEIASHPWRAVRISLSVRRENDSLRPELSMTHVGTEPVDVVLFDPATPGISMRADVTIDRGGGHTETAVLSPDEVTSLADRGSLPRGIASMNPGTTYRVALPIVRSPPNADPIALSVTVMLWTPGPGRARRTMQARAEWHSASNEPSGP